jgi:hypothetical protein
VSAVPGHADSGNEGDEHEREHHVAALLTALSPLRGAAVDRHPGEPRGKNVNTV